jgi:hypothetical protein
MQEIDRQQNGLETKLFSGFAVSPLGIKVVDSGTAWICLLIPLFLPPQVGYSILSILLVFLLLISPFPAKSFIQK